MSSPPRTMTLEAQRVDLSNDFNLKRRINSLFIGPEIPNDVAE